MLLVEIWLSALSQSFRDLMGFQEPRCERQHMLSGLILYNLWMDWYMCFNPCSFHILLCRSVSSILHISARHTGAPCPLNHPALSSCTIWCLVSWFLYLVFCILYYLASCTLYLASCTHWQLEPCILYHFFLFFAFTTLWFIVLFLRIKTVL